MLWDLSSGACLKALLQHAKAVCSLSVDWMTNQAMSCSVDRTLLLWDIEAGEPLDRYDKHPGTVWCMDIDWDGRRMVSGAGPGDNTIRLWDFSDGYCVHEIFGHEGSVWACSVDWATAHRAAQEALGIGVDEEQDG